MNIHRNSRNAQQWAEVIQNKWQENVSSIFEVGGLLDTAREELGPAEFSRMVREELKWSKSTAHKLITIFNDDKLAAVSPGKLPAAWTMLYELTKLTDEEFQSGLKSGVIHAGMERKDIAQLKPPKPPREPKKAKLREFPQSVMPKDEVVLGEVQLLVNSIAPELDDNQRTEFFSELRTMIDQLEQNAAKRRSRQLQEAAA